MTVKTVTKFNVPCYFAGKKSQVAIYIGEPERTHHPIFFQAKFIQDERGGVIPQEIMDSLAKLKQLAEENGVPFEELCRYALSSLSSNGEVSDSPAPAPQLAQSEAQVQSASEAPASAAIPENIATVIPEVKAESILDENKVSTEPSQEEPKQEIREEAIIASISPTEHAPSNASEEKQTEENSKAEGNTIDTVQNNTEGDKNSST